MNRQPGFRSGDTYRRLQQVFSMYFFKKLFKQKCPPLKLLFSGNVVGDSWLSFAYDVYVSLAVIEALI